MFVGAVIFGDKRKSAKKKIQHKIQKQTIHDISKISQYDSHVP